MGRRGPADGSRRWAIALTLALHVLTLAALRAYEPSRNAIFDAAPIMVDWVMPPKPELVPPTPPKPLPVRPQPRRVEPRPEPLPMIVPSNAPTTFESAAPETPTPLPPIEAVAPPAPAPQPAATVTPPSFNAAYLDNPPPRYPPLARRSGEQGTVLVHVRVSAKGTADAVEVRKSSGFPRLDEAALEAVRQWRFVPARQGDQPIAAAVLVPINFTLER